MGQTWNGDLLHDGANVISDSGGFLSGPPGDPGLIRVVAGWIGRLHDEFEVERRALNEAIDELRRVWTGDATTAFARTWVGEGAETAPARLLLDVAAKLDRFEQQLRDYADNSSTPRTSTGSR